MVAKMDVFLLLVTVAVGGVLSKNHTNNHHNNHQHNHQATNFSDIATVLEQRGNYTVALELLTSAGLLDSLVAETEATFFIPTDAAFAEIDLDTIKNDKERLQYHVVPEKFSFKKSDQDQELTSLTGQQIRINRYNFVGHRVYTAEGVEIDNHERDVHVANGFLQGLKGVMKVAEGDAADIMESRDDMKGLAQSIKLAGLETYIADDHNITIFAPTDDALNSIDDEVKAYLKNNTNHLKQILLYHIINRNTLYSAGFHHSMTFHSADGRHDSVMMFQHGDEFFINDAKITETDISATNGVIHVIDKVLIPPRVVQALEHAGIAVVG